MEHVLNQIFGDGPQGDVNGASVLASVAGQEKSDPVALAIEEARQAGYEVPPMPRMTAALELITPEYAQELKANMIKNRTPSTTDVGILTDDMNAYRFYATNQGIGINERGETIDGNHRLTAIIKSKKPQWMMVVRGISKDALIAIDRNKKRSAGNHLQMLGYSYGSELASIGRLAEKAERAWARGYKISAAQTIKFGDQSLINDIILGKMLMEIAGEGADVDALKNAATEVIEASRNLYETARGAQGIPKSVGGAFYYLARTWYGLEETDRFIEKAGRGLGLEEGDAPRALRSKIDKMKAEAENGNKPMPQGLEYLGYLIVAFNKFVTNVPDVQVLTLPRNGTLPNIAIRK